MKITELKKIAEENDYKLKSDFIRLRFEREVECGVNQVDINKLFPNRLWISNPGYCDEKDFNMIKAAVVFAETHPDDREEEKKFYLKHRWLTSCGWNYVSIDSKEGPILDDDSEYDYKKPKFTLKEIDEIKKKFDTDLKDFELIEVEDEE